MRVLLSAYACRPNQGSEPEVGWQRAMHMRAYADEVWVLTRCTNRAAIEAEPMSRAPGLHFIYYDLPWWPRKRQETPWFVRAYSVLWQWGAYRLAARLHRDKPFDCVYHVTFTSMQFGSFMGRLGIPFIIGPIGGGERTPFRLRRSMTLSCKVKELLRDLGIVLQRCGPLARPAFAVAERIYVSSLESLCLVPYKWHQKVTVQLSIATCRRVSQQTVRQPPQFPRFVYVGRLLHWKGVHFAIRAMALVKQTIPAATLTLIGHGPDERWLRDVAKKHGVADAVEFAGHIPTPQLIDTLRSSTAFVFPSLHDSGGMVALEAFMEGLPVVCLGIGGPGTVVNASCGFIVPTADADEDQVVTGIANAMITVAALPAAEWMRLSMGAIARANELSWARLTEDIASCHKLERSNAAIIQ
jgi:glycosyltransferase involved in cell wall biosynthesis